MTLAAERIEVVWSVLSRGFGRVPAALPLSIWQSEVREWVVDARDGSRHKERRTLLREHDAAVAGARAELRRCLGRRLTTFDSAITNLLVPHPHRRDLTAARRAINRLGVALDSASTRQAAWDDIVAAAEAATSPEAARTAVVQLEALLDRAGYDAKQRIGSLTGLLEGSALDVAEALVALERRRPGRWPHHRSTSRLSSQARLDLCRDLVGVSAAATTCVVWLAYRRARLAQDELSAGGVAFVRLDKARDEVHRTGYLLGTPFAGADALPADDPSDDIALVQVTLEDHLPRDAIRDAVSIVDAVTGDIAANAVGTTWRQLGWTRATYASGGGTTSFFATSAELADIRRSYDHERSAQRLAERADQLTKAVRRRSPYDALIADALCSRADARAASSVRNAIVLLGRSVESAAVASKVDLDQIREVACAEWPWAAIRSDLRHATVLAVGRDDMSLTHDPNRAELAQQIITDDQETWSDLVSTAAVVRLASELAACAENAIELRNAELLVQTLTDPETYLRRVARLEEDARLYQDRSRRIRNALMHGNPISEAALTSARGWWEYIADVATHIATDGYGRSPRRTLQAMQARRERFERKLRNGTPPFKAYAN